VRWSASELGVHTVDVQYAQLAVLGSPFACKVFDVSKVVILYDQLHDDESADVVFYGPSISVTFFYSRDLRSFKIRFEFESAVPIRFDATVMGRFENFRIGRVCPLLVVVRRLKPLTALSGTVYRLASSISDHTPVLFNAFEPLRIGIRNL